MFLLKRTPSQTEEVARLWATTILDDLRRYMSEETWARKKMHAEAAAWEVRKLYHERVACLAQIMRQVDQVRGYAVLSFSTLFHPLAI